MTTFLKIDCGLERSTNPAGQAQPCKDVGLKSSRTEPLPGLTSLAAVLLLAKVLRLTVTPLEQL